MLRCLLAALLLTGLSACTHAADPKPDAPATDAKPAAPKLAIGDPAPPLKPPAKWVKGEPVAAFAPGKVYVVDFWATWCGPCIKSMPHLNDLQAEYKDQGLVALAVTTKDPNNTAEAVEQFVKTKGAGYSFGFAFYESEDLYKSYMEAAGQDGIPCSFVIDKAGKVAFIGHPLELDDVLPKVLAGTWRGKEDIAEIRKSTEELEAIFEKAEKDAAGALTDLTTYEAKYPAKAKQEQFVVSKVVLLLQAKKYDDAKALTEPVLKAATARKKAETLNTVRMIWSSVALNPDKKYVDLAVTAGEAGVSASGGKEPIALVGAAEAYHVAGDKAKAVEYATKAVAAAESDRQRDFLTKQLAKYKGEPAKDDKK